MGQIYQLVNWNILMTTIKSIITKNSKTDQNFAKIKQNSLKKVIQAVSQKQEVSDKIEAIAIAEELQNQLEKDIAKEIDIEFNLGFDEKTVHSQPP